VSPLRSPLEEEWRMEVRERFNRVANGFRQTTSHCHLPVETVAAWQVRGNSPMVLALPLVLLRAVMASG
jgi:hypothetical protein